MNNTQQTTLWLGAFRYYLGRRTYAVSEFCELLIQEWPTLDDETKNLIESELENDFVRDNIARKHQLSYLPLGMDCDRAQWEKIKELYK
jgi:hypothetical protein